jgi:hypothetical protein
MDERSQGKAGWGRALRRYLRTEALSNHIDGVASDSSTKGVTEHG